MTHAIFFDVDGVLVPPWRFRDLLEQQHRITPQMTAPFFRGPFVECVLGRARLEDELPRYLEQWGWRDSVAEFIRIWLESEHVLDEQVLRTVDGLRRGDTPCFIASNQERLRARYLVRDMGLGDRFDGVFFSCDLGLKKPDTEYFVEVARRSGFAPKTLILIDDTPACVEAARAAGWTAYHYTGPAKLFGDLTMLGVG